MNSTKKRLILFIISVLAFSTIAFAGSSPSAEEQSAVSAYGAGISSFMDKAEDITPKEFFKTIGLFKTTVGRTLAVIDVATKTAGGDKKEAAISAAFTALSELAATKKGEAVLKFCRIGSVTFTALITAYQIKRASDQALKSSTDARLLESLYGTIESNIILHKRNRKFGQGGDPIPVTHEAVDYVWKKIVNGDWRSAFKPYVTEVMHATWPETSYWDRWTKPKEVQTQNSNKEILQRENEYKKYITTLLATLNNLAKSREATHEIKVILGQFQYKLSQGSSDLRLYKYFKAKKVLPEIKKFLKMCPKYISEGLKNNDLGEIYAATSNSRDYLSGVMIYLPQNGKIGIENKKINDALKICYEKSRNARMIYLQHREAYLLKDVKTTVWQATRVGFNLDFDTIKNEIEYEYKNIGSIEKISKIIEKSHTQMLKDYKVQFNGVRDSYKKMREHGNNNIDYTEAFNKFAEQLGVYEDMDNEKYSYLLTEVNSFLKELQNAYTLEVSELDILYQQADNIAENIKVAFNTTMISDYDSMNSFPSSNYVGLQKLKFPKMHYYNRIIGTNGLPMAHDYLDSLRRSIIKERRNLNYHIGLVQRLYSFNIKDSEKSMYQYIQISKMINSFIASSKFHILLMKDKGIKSKNIEMKNFIKRVKPRIEHFLSLQKSAQNNEQRYETDLSNMENDMDYLRRLENVVWTSSNLIISYRDSFHGGAHGYYKPNINIENCDILSTTKNPLITKDDIHASMQKLKIKLLQSGLVWFDSKYNIGLNEYLEKLQKYYQKDAAPDHYMFYKEGGFCEFLTKTQIDHIHEKLKNLLPIKNCDRKFNDSFRKNAGGLGSMLINTAKGYGDLGFDYARVPKDHLNFLVQFSKNVLDKATKKSLLSILNIARTIDKEFWDCKVKSKYYSKMQNRYFEMLIPLDRSIYDVNYENMHVADTNKLIDLINKALSMKSNLYGFLDQRINDTHLSQDGKDSFAKFKKDLINKFNSLEEFLRNLKLSISHKKQQKQKQQKQQEDNNLIVNFYAKFKEAYESKDVSAVMAYISDDWCSSSDGTSIDDLEMNLENSFRVFDEIQYSISNLDIQSMGEDKFRVSYDVSIIGEIYDSDITHEEKSSVQEEVGIKNRKIMILKTFGGQYWSIK